MTTTATSAAGKVTKLEAGRVAHEVALAEFDRFADMMDLDLDESLMQDEDRAELAKQKKRIVKEICNGSLVVNELGEVVFTPRHARSKYKEPLTFHEQSGASIMAIDSKSHKARVGAVHAILGDMCGVNANVFASLVGSDYKVCTAIFALLMD